MEQIEGRTIDFGVGQVDDNYLAIQELFFDDLRYKCPSVFESEYSDQGLKEKNYIVKNFNALGECIVCHNNLRESVFVPCGHRCACYNCAVIVYAVTKRCPRCNEEASCIIKKIYEWDLYEFKVKFFLFYINEYFLINTLINIIDYLLFIGNNEY